MAWGTTVVITPLLLLFSLPLVVFAIITTSLAFWLLLSRAAAVYYELLVALLQAYINPPSTSAVSLPPSPTKQRSPRSRDGCSPDLLKRTNPKSQRSATLATSNPLRDFEGVGGWRLPEDDGLDEALWMGMNSRLELPTAAIRRQQRSYTPSSPAVSGRASPELVRTPLFVRTAGTKRRAASGRDSPDSYFSISPTVTMNGDRDSRVAFASDQKRSGSSSSTSLGSVKLTRQADTRSLIMGPFGS